MQNKVDDTVRFLGDSLIISPPQVIGSIQPVDRPLFIHHHVWKKRRFWHQVKRCECGCFRIGRKGKILVEAWLLPSFEERIIGQVAATLRESTL